MKIFNNKKGSIMIYIVVIIMILIIILITAVIAPMGAVFSTRMYENSEEIMKLGNSSLNNIDNAEVKANIQDMYDGALASTEDNINITTALFKYSWLFIIVLVVLVGFIYTRRLTEYGGGFI